MNDRLGGILIRDDATLRDAMKVIDAGGVEIALMVDGEGRLVGTLSDGDVRRALLRGDSLDDLASPSVNGHPHVVSISAPRSDVLAVMRSNSLSQVPVLDDEGRLVGLHVMQEILGAPAFQSLTVEVPLAVPHLAGNEARYVQECIETNFVSSVGPFVDRFEQEFAASLGAGFAVACSSGTAALHIALLLAGAGPGVTVAVPTFTFIASANAAAYTGADVLLVDSEPRTWNMDGELLRDELRARAARGSPLPAVIEVVHILGHPADMEPLLAIRDEFGIPIVEDAAEALGATCRGQMVGTIGEIGCFSFNGNKTITSGGGGMLVTNDAELARRAKHLTTQAKLPGRGYVHDEVGFNYRLSNIAAAIGVAQLEQLPEFLAVKRRIAATYDDALADLPVQLPPRAPWAEPSCWLYSILSETAPSKSIVDALVADGIESRPVWHPLHRQGPYERAEILGGGVAEEIATRGLSLPCSVGLDRGSQSMVVDRLRRVLSG